MSPPSCPEFLHLASELVENVIKQLNNRTDLSNVRLVCKLLDRHAVKELFKDVYVSPQESHLVTWDAISNDDAIRQIPRHAIIHTDPDIEFHGWGWRDNRVVDEDDEDGDAPTFKKALAALSRFPNLDSLEIAFTPECLGREHGYWEEVDESWEDRQENLSLIFQAIKDRAADKNNRTIRKLTIINLQNCPIPEFSSSDLFRDVMGQLEELHISMVHEYNDHGPDHDYTKIELQTFPSYFCTHWLKPISGNLKALSIYSGSDNWGPFPGYFDPSGIAFPKLETLALGYYTLAHDSDLDWVLAIKSLRKLILHNCMIASYVRISSDNLAKWKPPMHGWTRLSDDETNWCKDFAYNGKWSQHLDRIAEGLPALFDFQFGYQDSYDEPKYEITNRGNCPTEIFHQRYITFDNGILPTHWPEPRYEEGRLHSWGEHKFPNLHEENLDADQKSLDALLRKVMPRSSSETPELDIVYALNVK
ncbi:hypothetical protein yc1106_09842 [Curvularia clavata]|uniref:F-box domain-containing protein n=1 Tax=Curvularia clavata TaxID=95742 RepID=A0A9Q9DVT4_CURCL|nr:hypothetical protein yc1106_09842 [Curvularia clavata]